MTATSTPSKVKTEAVRLSGHALTITRSGVQSGVARAHCKCGWCSGPKTTNLGARVAYRTHIESEKKRAAA